MVQSRRCRTVIKPGQGPAQQFELLDHLGLLKQPRNQGYCASAALGAAPDKKLVRTHKRVQGEELKASRAVRRQDSAAQGIRDRQGAIQDGSVMHIRPRSESSLSEVSTGASSTESWDPIGFFSNPEDFHIHPTNLAKSMPEQWQECAFVDDNRGMAPRLSAHSMQEVTLGMQGQRESPASSNILATSPFKGHLSLQRSYTLKSNLGMVSPSHCDAGSRVAPEQFSWPGLATSPNRTPVESKANVAISKFLAGLWLPSVSSQLHGEADKWKILESILVAAMPEHYDD
eukprot:TRINITY_DN41343_c0_g1_i1.p1 TRINITY_DN41343_c0_g1~~TRINITY_DN41343_c0_g1_i1.p1  ORF type:complete len:287 (-),score=39.98 TRINITY_DN41343_c0_g1_i1:23-883(-)